MSTQIIAFANQKGGVGKTTLAVHMACLAHQLGLKTLLVDLDQQGSATYLATGDGNRHKTLDDTALDLWDNTKRAPLFRSPVFGFDLLQASYGLDRVDNNPSAAVLALRKLRILDSGEGLYDIAIIDCPPAPNVRQTASILVADAHVIPVTPDALGTQGLSSMVDLSLNELRGLNPNLKIRILINRLKANSPNNRAIAANIRNTLPEFTIPLSLFEREDVRSALRSGKPYWEYSRDKEQKKIWYDVFYGLLGDVPAVAAEEETEIEPPETEDEVDAIREEQEAQRGATVEGGTEEGFDPDVLGAEEQESATEEDLDDEDLP